MKLNWAFWLPLRFLQRQLRAFEGMLGRKNVVWPRYSSDVEQFFFMFLPHAVIYYGSHHLDENASDMGLPLFISIYSLFMRPSGCAKCLLSNFRRKIIEKNTGLRRNFFPDSYNFTRRPNSQLLVPCCYEVVFAKRPLVCVDSRVDKCLFFNLIFFKIWIIVVILRCYLFCSCLFSA